VGEQRVGGVDGDLPDPTVGGVGQGEGVREVVSVDQQEEGVVGDPFAELVAVGDAAAVEEDREAGGVPGGPVLLGHVLAVGA
jgi:hypothetical protein